MRAYSLRGRRVGALVVGALVVGRWSLVGGSLSQGLTAFMPHKMSSGVVSTRPPADDVKLASDMCWFYMPAQSVLFFVAAGGEQVYVRAVSPLVCRRSARSSKSSSVR